MEDVNWWIRSLGLTESELLEFDRISHRLIELGIAKRYFAIADLLDEWSRAVAWEGTYPDDLRAYVNDLDVRDLLAEATVIADPEAQRRLITVCQILDDEFRRRTVPDVDRQLEEYADPNSRWWWERVPTSVKW